MTNHSLKLLVFISLFFIACEDETPISIYASCCSTNAIVAQIGTGKIYVPNIITPDNTGINDVLWPYGSSEISIVNKFEIKRGNTILFQQEDFPANEPEYGWDGTYNGTVLKGVFSVSVTATDINGSQETFIGEVCSLLCRLESEEVILDFFSNCKFSTQHDGEGGYDPTLPHFEADLCDG